MQNPLEHKNSGKSKKTAIIIGATGATGNKILRLLLLDNRYKTIKLFSRKTCGIDNPKIEEHLGDLLHLETFSNDFTGDEVYCCIGTTKRQTPDKAMYTKIDFGIPAAAAKLTKMNNISTFVVMSSMGADIDSATFYTKTKGEMENFISSLYIPRTHIFRPSLLLRKTNEIRLAEFIIGRLMVLFDFLFVGRFRKYRAIKTITVASAMITAANSNVDSKTFLSDDIELLGSRDV